MTSLGRNISFVGMYSRTICPRPSVCINDIGKIHFLVFIAIRGDNRVIVLNVESIISKMHTDLNAFTLT